MKPLILFSAPLAVGFLFVPDLWYFSSTEIFMLLLVEPPTPSPAIAIITDVLLGLTILFSLFSISTISNYHKKELPVSAVVDHRMAARFLFITIVFDVISMICFMFTEPGMKPHPIAEPDRAAPTLVADPRTTESLFLLVGVIFASASMLSLLTSQLSRHHSHCLPLILAIFCTLSILVGALYYWF